jgi:predicted nuclease with RNAse H fold
VWAGVDVGGARKGFDAAVVDARSLVARTRLREPAGVVSWLRPFSPRVVAVDSPRACAPPGTASRPEERELAARICGIRYTPARELVADEANAYYEWIRRGLALYEALPDEWTVVECFPTATWTQLHGPRAGRSRARWSAEALRRAGLEGLPPRMGQDLRDAVGAALTARFHDRGETDRLGDIVVPRPPRAGP